MNGSALAPPPRAPGGRPGRAPAAGGAGGARALYDQPGEKLLGQMQAAVNVALDFPGVFPAFYGFLTPGAPPGAGGGGRRAPRSPRDAGTAPPALRPRPGGGEPRPAAEPLAAHEPARRRGARA